MTCENRNPAPIAGTGLPHGVLLGGERLEDSLPGLITQPWTVAREFEVRSRIAALSALRLRGADRLNGLALASAYAGAARVAACQAGGAE